MGNITWSQVAFNGGQVDDLLSMRVDLKKYANTCSKLENFLPVVQGPAVKRAGSKLEAVLDGFRDIIPFYQGTTETFFLAVGTTDTKVYKMNASGHASNDLSTLVTTLTHPGGVTIVISAGTNSYAQSNDVLFMCTDQGVFEYRYAASTFTVQRFENIGGPFADVDPENVDKVRLDEAADVKHTASDTLASTASGTNTKDKSADGNTSTFFQPVLFGDAIIDAAYIGQDLGSSKYVRYAKMLCGYAAPAAIALQKSSNATDWTTVEMFYPSAAANVWQTYTVSGSAYTSARYWRILAKAAVPNDDSWTVKELELYDLQAVIVSDTDIFLSTDVGKLFYVENPLAYNIPAWEASKSVTAGDLRLSDGKVYAAVSNGTTGTVKPTHEYDTVSDGGVQWTYQDNGSGYVRMMRYVTNKQMVYEPLPGVNIPAGAIHATTTQTSRYAFDSWRTAYPTAATIYKSRLCFLGANPAKLWMSVSNDFYDFSAKDRSGDVVKDQAVSLTFLDQEESVALWMVDMGNLVIGTTASIKLIRPQNDNEAFGAGNAEAQTIVYDGAREKSVAVIGKSIYYIGNNGRLLSLTYKDTFESFDATEEELFNPSRGGHKFVCVANENDGILFIGDGEYTGAAGYFVTVSKEQDVSAWAKAMTRKSGSTSNDVVLNSKATGANVRDIYGREYFVTVVNRDSVYCMESYLMTPYYAVGGLQTGTDTATKFLDMWCAGTVTGTTTKLVASTILDSFANGVTMAVLFNGKYLGTAAVVAGTPKALDVTALSPLVATNAVTFGFPYSAIGGTNRVEGGSEKGIAQTKIKRIPHANFRFYRTGQVKVGTKETVLEPVTCFTPVTTSEAANAALWYTGDKKVLMRGGYETDNRLYFVSDEPYPCTVCGIVAELETNDR